MLLGFQAHDLASDKRRVRFTVNLQVIRRAWWEEQRQGERPWFPERPTANTTYASDRHDYVWWQRLGELIPPDPHEIWWEVRAGMDTTQLADAIVWAIDEYGLPALKQRATLA